ncbi:pirin family protein [Geminocystis herdmanii]|uniref:pirin family protein n=1 Tax=Geminocystis herdmanii TaxID=669359 RepID=UPI000349A474|nr:hypothetical protein [Geminocystis herdmanii]
MEDKQGKLCLLASADGRENSLTIHQKVNLFASILKTGETINYTFDDDDYGWIQIIKGEVSIDHTTLKAGDGASIQGEKEVRIISHQPDTEFLWFHFT